MVRCRAKGENYSYDFAASLQNTNEQSNLISERDLTAWKGAAERMLTNEIVLKVFSDYLNRDTDFEVVLTSRGYTVMGFDNHRQDWNTVDFCPTPEALRDSLLSSLFLSFVFIKLVRYADKNCEGGKLPIPVHVLGEELTACGVIPDLSRKISVIRSRNISMSCVFQNLAGLQNRYPLNQWQEILGNSDVQLFLGCVDELTAKYISDRSGEVSVHVQSKAKQLGTWRISNYTPEYRETSGVGKRKLLTMDEVLRLPISKALIIIRGRKLLQVDKCDYTEHPESKKMISCKASAHIPEWQKQQPKEVEEVSPAPIKKPGRKIKTPASNVVPTDKDSIMSKN